ncbi:hypothetical protein, partial [Allisonella histaminiformans]|uniref:hypothetical protein n=1 Tax=Allisonella histaminiformans TaxID=209880 RepID=UPI00388D5461
LFAESTLCNSCGIAPIGHDEVKAPTYIRSGCTDREPQAHLYLLFSSGQLSAKIYTDNKKTEVV